MMSEEPSRWVRWIRSGGACRWASMTGTRMPVVRSGASRSGTATLDCSVTTSSVTLTDLLSWNRDPLFLRSMVTRKSVFAVKIPAGSVLLPRLAAAPVVSMLRPLVRSQVRAAPSPMSVYGTLNLATAPTTTRVRRSWAIPAEVRSWLPSSNSKLLTVSMCRSSLIRAPSTTVPCQPPVSTTRTSASPRVSSESWDLSAIGSSSSRSVRRSSSGMVPSRSRSSCSTRCSTLGSPPPRLISTSEAAISWRSV